MLPVGHQRVFRLAGAKQDTTYTQPSTRQVDSWTTAYTRIGQFLIETIPFCVRPLTRAEYRFCLDRKGQGVCTHSLSSALLLHGEGGLLRLFFHSGTFRNGNIIPCLIHAGLKLLLTAEEEVD